MHTTKTIQKQRTSMGDSKDISATRLDKMRDEAH